MQIRLISSLHLSGRYEEILTDAAIGYWLQIREEISQAAGWLCVRTATWEELLFLSKGVETCSIQLIGLFLLASLFLERATQ